MATQVSIADLYHGTWNAQVHTKLPDQGLQKIKEQKLKCSNCQGNTSNECPKKCPEFLKPNQQKAHWTKNKSKSRPTCKPSHH